MKLDELCVFVCVLRIFPSVMLFICTELTSVEIISPLFDWSENVLNLILIINS